MAPPPATPGLDGQDPGLRLPGLERWGGADPPSSPVPARRLAVPSLSTHVLDAAAGGPLVGVAVTVTDVAGAVVASGTTDNTGRVGELATGLAPGTYRIGWETGGDFLAGIAAVVILADDRHYHVPLLASPVSAVTYLGV